MSGVRFTQFYAFLRVCFTSRGFFYLLVKSSEGRGSKGFIGSFKVQGKLDFARNGNTTMAEMFKDGGYLRHI